MSLSTHFDTQIVTFLPVETSLVIFYLPIEQESLQDIYLLDVFIC